MRQKIYVSRVIPEPGMSLLYENFDVSANENDAPPTRDEFLNSTRGCDGVLVTLTEKIDEEFLNGAKTLKAVSSYSMGLDHVDIAACTRHAVLVTNTPDVLTNATADLAFALILASLRRLAEGDRYIREGKWNAPWSPNLLVGQDASEATLGIAGFGRIGRAVARRALGFGMRVVYYDRKGEIKNFHDASYLPLNELLNVSDIVSVHLPLTKETRHLFGEREFSMMKKTAVFVNTSRGGLVDQDALTGALKNRKIFAAGIDVFEKEPISSNDPLLKLDNVVLVPHLGSASVRSRAGMAELAARNLIDALSGRVPKAVANGELLNRMV
ncbi:MAG: 2-hydroxyacid dehydrogenase [Nitrososphaerales archaeon]